MSNQAIKDLVENPHRIYNAYNRYWSFLLDSYEGGIDYTKAYIKDGSVIQGGSEIEMTINGKTFSSSTVTSNLFKHKKERSEDYGKRIEQSYYYNFCSPIIDIYTNHLFKEPVITDFGNIESVLESRKENIDRKGSNIIEFRKEVSELSQIYGHISVVTDVPQDQGELTLQDRKVKDKFPYFAMYHPQDVLNWAVDQFGEPYWVLLREVGDSAIDPTSVNKDNRVSIHYRLWTRTDWQLYDKEYNLVDQANHIVGKVPITNIFNKRSKKANNFLGISALADIAFIARDVYNASSELKQILRDQTFSFLAVQGKSSDYNETTIGVNKGLIYPEGTNVPQYVSPPGENAKVYFEYIDKQVRKMFQLAKLEGGSASQEQEASVKSGVSKAWDFNQTNSALSQKASNMNDGEVKLWQMFAAWEGKKFDGNISYPDEFSIQSLQDDLIEAEQSFKLQLGVEYEQAVKESIIKKKFPRAKEEDVTKMIDSMKTPKNEPIRLSQRLGLFGKTKNVEDSNISDNK